MRSCSAGLEDDIANRCTSLCRLWTVTRTDGTIFRFTDCDRPVVYSGNTYRSDLTFTTSAIFLAASFANAQNVTMLVMTGDDGISQDDMRQRRFLAATCLVEVINYRDTSHGTMVLFAGTVGRQEMSDKKMARIEFLPKSASAAGAFGAEVYSAPCRNSFGDANCTKDLEALKASFTLTVVSGSVLTAVAFNGQPLNYWALGFIKWSTGNNVGLITQVASSTGSTVTIVEIPGKAIQVGDTGVIKPGCDHLIETCFAKWNNVANFRGEPDVPEIGFLPMTPITKST